MPNSGLELRVETVADELILAVHAGDHDRARHIAAQHADIGGHLIAALAARCPALPVTDVYAQRRQRVEQARAMQAKGVPDRVIQARMARFHRQETASSQDAS